MARNRVTIYDIAREAGVSPATVSRILKGSSVVSEEKADRVSKLIRKYNFHPSAVARALSETRTKMIGMVMADTGNPYYSSVYSACCDEAYQRGYIPMLLSTQSCPEMEVSALTKLAEQRADAIIVCGGRVDLIEPDTAFTRLLMSIRETTHIVLGSRSHYERIYGISVDHETSMNLAVDYLAKLGHRDIGFFYTGTQYYGTKEKMERFHQEMALHGLPVREEWMIQVQGYDCGSGREGIERLLTLERLEKIKRGDAPPLGATRTSRRRHSLYAPHVRHVHIRLPEGLKVWASRHRRQGHRVVRRVIDPRRLFQALRKGNVK